MGCSFEIPNHLEKKQEILKKRNNIWLRVSPGQNKIVLESYNLSLLMFIAVVGRPFHCTQGGQ